VILQQLASAEAVLTKDERELGTAVIDIGGGTTDIAVFIKNAVQFTKVLAVGGAHFTRDLAIGLQTPMEDAERIKKESGTVLTERTMEGEAVVIPGMGTRAARSVSRRAICDILRDRAAEILELIKDQLWKAVENERLIAGVVITGGGSMLDGMLELTEEMRGLTEELSHPVYATSVGLALFGAEEAGYRKKNIGKTNGSSGFFGKILSWTGK
jgi:cell division protein FtsA